MGKNNYLAKDCLEIKCENKEIDLNDEFLCDILRSDEEINIFSLNNRKNITRDRVVYIDYEDKKWKAGRYIGYIEKKYNNKTKTLKIIPRFGEKILFSMLGDIFNVRRKPDSSKANYSNDKLFIKKLISFIWIKKVNDVYRYGFPKNRKTILENQYFSKGKLETIKTAFSLRKNKTIVSSYAVNDYDKIVMAILYKAYEILKKDKTFSLNEILTNSLDNDAVRDISKIGYQFRNVDVSEKQYRSIAYKPIYANYSDVVDFSWSIINSRAGMSDGNRNVCGYMLDMAEIWECYCRNILLKKLKPAGWNLINNKFVMYDDSNNRRTIIPDIVLGKDDKLCVFDAKYKKMQFRESKDVDREDFFQIHTYISYLNTLNHVIVGGLVYPIEQNKLEIENTKSYFLDREESNCVYIANGPIVTEKSISNDVFINQIEEICKNY